MRRNKVDFEFTKDWGTIKKGDKYKMKIARARSLQDVRKVGKIVKPKANKAEPKATKRETK